jgi:hypothetical protein
MKDIQLSQGKVALVDDDDFEWLNQWKWTLSKENHTCYAIRKESRTLNNGKQKTLLMHRVILEMSDTHKKVDHIDRNGLNNQKSNLRTVNDSQSSHNRGSFKVSTSKYKGVSFSKNKYDRKKWIAKFTKNGKGIFIGRFFTEEEAALAYNKRVVEENGEFAYVNIIETGIKKTA